MGNWKLERKRFAQAAKKLKSVSIRPSLDGTADKYNVVREGKKIAFKIDYKTQRYLTTGDDKDIWYKYHHDPWSRSVSQ